MASWKNWSEETRHDGIKVYEPTTEQQLIDAVNDARDNHLKVRVVGSGHAWSNIGLRKDGEDAGNASPPAADPGAVSPGYRGGAVILTHGLKSILAVDRDAARKTVKIEAGAVLAEASEKLYDEYRLTFPTMGDTDRQTVAGAISTDTHGSGAKLRSLADYVTGIEMVLADGTCRALDDRELKAARVSLGMLGAIYSVTFQVTNTIYLNHHRTLVRVPDDFDNLDAHFHNNRHVEYWYFPYTDHADLMLRETTHPTNPGIYLIETEQLRAEGRFLDFLGRVRPSALPWAFKNGTNGRRDEHRVGPAHTILPLVSQSTVDDVKTHTMEYLFPYEKLREAFEQLQLSITAARDDGIYVGIPVHIRFIKQSRNSLLSPYVWPLTASFSVNFSTKHEGFEQWFRDVERRMLDPSIGGRPHLGKIHFKKPDIPAEFEEIRKELDPGEMFWSPEDIYREIP